MKSELKSHPYKLNLTASLAARMKNYADAFGTQYSEQIRRALDEWLKAKGY